MHSIQSGQTVLVSDTLAMSVPSNTMPPNPPNNKHMRLLRVIFPHDGITFVDKPDVTATVYSPQSAGEEFLIFKIEWVSLNATEFALDIWAQNASVATPSDANYICSFVAVGKGK